MLGRLLSRLRRTESPTKRLGRRGEQAAASFLRREGYRILGRNVRVKIGEADIVCEAPDRRTIVIVEVKTRLRGAGKSAKSESMSPEFSVHHRKRKKLAAIARVLIRANGWADRPVRIDVIAVDWPASGEKPTLRHHIGIQVRS